MVASLKLKVIVVSREHRIPFLHPYSEPVEPLSGSRSHRILLSYIHVRVQACKDQSHRNTLVHNSSFMFFFNFMLKFHLITLDKNVFAVSNLTENILCEKISLKISILSGITDSVNSHFQLKQLA